MDLSDKLLECQAVLLRIVLRQPLLLPVILPLEIRLTLREHLFFQAMLQCCDATQELPPFSLRIVHKLDEYVVL